MLSNPRSQTPCVMVILCCVMAVSLSFLVLCGGCQRKEHVQPKPHWFKHYTQYNEKDYKQFIESQVNNEHDSSLYASLTSDFYRARDFHPFWTQKGLQEALSDTLLASLDNAYRLHGIPAEYFGLDSIHHSISQLVEHQVPNDNSPYSHLYCLERQLTDVTHVIEADDLATLIYTSGTSGKAKGVMLSHRNLCHNIIESLKAHPCSKKDRFLSILPMAHAYEMGIGCLYAIFVGACVYYIQKPPTPSILISFRSKT